MWLCMVEEGGGAIWCVKTALVLVLRNVAETDGIPLKGGCFLEDGSADGLHTQCAPGTLLS